jgi:FkbM family methyltransferase
MKKEIVVFLKCLRYGLFPGLLLYFKLKLFKFKTIRVPNLRHPVVLRRNTSDLAVFEQIFFFDIYGFDTPYVPGTIIDCGANIGLASVFFANKFPTAKIIAIEPEKSNFEMLKVNAALYPNIQPVNKAIWHQSTSLIIDDPGIGHHGFTTTEIAKIDSETIEAVTIVDLMSKYGIDSIDILKIDIEGAEMELFTYDFDAWLPKVRCIAIELHSFRDASKPFIKAISKYNFSLTTFGEGYLCFRD